MKQKSELFFWILKKMFESDIDDCFQVLQKGVKSPKINKWGFYSFSKKINQSLFHLLSFYLPKYSKNQLNGKNFIGIKKGYLEILKNQRFVSVITGSGTNSKRNIKKSNQIFKKVFLEKYLGDWTDNQKRNITKSEKETIRQNVPYCYLCYGKFGKKMETGKIHAEHIEPYIAGKESELENILLAHPRCNAEKKDMSIDEYRVTPKSQKRRKTQKKNIMAYRQALKEWNKAYGLDIYSKLMKFAKSDINL
jgi:5-methylcytosine-specific restriction endonuclease McrA